MSKAYDKVMAGLGDAQGYLNGNVTVLWCMKLRCPSPTSWRSEARQDSLSWLLPRVSAFRLALSRIGGRHGDGQRGRHVCFLR